MGKKLDIQESKEVDAVMLALQENLPVLRKKLSLTQAELADQIGVSRQTIINIEKNTEKTNEDRKPTIGMTTYLALIMYFAFNPATAALLGPLGILTKNIFKVIGVKEVSKASKALESLLDIFKDKTK